jgi:CheY-like chemotaxis protein
MDGVHRSFDPDIVLTDYSMPDADGLELIREFRKMPSTRAVPIPILILSGHSEEHCRARTLAAGAADLVMVRSPRRLGVSSRRRSISMRRR